MSMRRQKFPVERGSVLAVSAEMVSPVVAEVRFTGAVTAWTMIEIHFFILTLRFIRPRCTVSA